MRNTFVDLHSIIAFGPISGFVISESLISSDILPFSVLLRSWNKSDPVVSLPLEGGREVSGSVGTRSPATGSKMCEAHVP